MGEAFFRSGGVPAVMGELNEAKLLHENPLTVNGKTLENVLEINKYLLLRDVNSVTVRRQNGSIINLKIPEDIGSKMFESGEMIPFSPVIPAVLDSIIPNSPAANIGLKSNDKIININGNKRVIN